jgi:transketolase
MGSILNGMALHGGSIPFGSTFMVFGDYMRAPIRVAAISKLRVIFVLTHDSIAVGEDGPTHQPVEHLAAFRAIPDLVTLRPADANETAAAWKVALTRSGPTVIALTRQKLPTLDVSKSPVVEGTGKGAYILSDAPGGEPEIILIATGSEVSLAMQAQAKLAESKIRARVVSMPSWELFERQNSAYKEKVLPAKLTARLAIEAGVRMGWDRYVGLKGAGIWQEEFGVSGPYKEVLARFGFTVDNVIAKAKAVLGKT